LQQHRPLRGGNCAAHGQAQGQGAPAAAKHSGRRTKRGQRRDAGRGRRGWTPPAHQERQRTHDMIASPARSTWAPRCFFPSCHKCRSVGTKGPGKTRFARRWIDYSTAEIDARDVGQGGALSRAHLLGQRTAGAQDGPSRALRPKNLRARTSRWSKRARLDRRLLFFFFLDCRGSWRRFRFGLQNCFVRSNSPRFHDGPPSCLSRRRNGTANGTAWAPPANHSADNAIPSAVPDDGGGRDADLKRHAGWQPWG